MIGRYQPPPSVHIATVHYGESQPPELASKQVLIQQFYDQLEKMKATFNVEQTEPSPQLATNTLTFDNDGQVKQSTATNQLKEKTISKRIASATPPPNTKKPPVLKVRERVRLIKSVLMPISLLTKFAEYFFLRQSCLSFTLSAL